MIQKAEGIVIRTTDYGETNKIVTLYTKEFGKIGIMARGAKKPRSKLAAGTQLLTHSHFLFTRGKGLGTLYQSDPITPFRYIKSDILIMAYATYIVDFIDKLGDQDSKNPYLFEWVLQLLQYMNDGVHPRVLTYIFEVKMLPVLGITPELEACASCEHTDGPFAFSVNLGGILCKRCRHKDEHSIPISMATAKLLRVFKHIDVKRIGKIELKQQTIDELKRVLTAYYEAYSGMNLKTRRFIDQVEALNISGTSSGE